MSWLEEAKIKEKEALQEVLGGGVKDISGSNPLAAEAYRLPNIHPLCISTVPVLEPTEAWETTDVHSHCPVLVQTGGYAVPHVYLYYVNYGGGLGLAISSDGFTFVKEAGNPLLTPAGVPDRKSVV